MFHCNTKRVYKKKKSCVYCIGMYGYERLIGRETKKKGVYPNFRIQLTERVHVVCDNAKVVCRNIFSVYDDTYMYCICIYYTYMYIFCLFTLSDKR